jgi:hypothetical protein
MTGNCGSSDATAFCCVDTGAARNCAGALGLGMDMTGISAI